jgi:hypothetical protein
MLYVFYLQNTDGLIVTGMTSQITTACTWPTWCSWSAWRPGR